MTRAEEKRQQILGLVLLTIILVFYFNMLLLPMIGKFRQVKQETARYRGDLAVTQAGLARMEEVKKDIERLETLVGHTKQRFPTEREIPILLEELSRIADQTEVKILEISPGEMNQTAHIAGINVGGLRELPVTMRTLSKYHAFGAFVNALENSEQIYLIEDISMQSLQDDERIRSVRMVLKAFLKKEEE